MWTPLPLFLLLVRSSSMSASSCTHVTPSSGQFSEYQPITVSCRQHNLADWMVWRYTLKRSEPLVTPCGSDWGERTPSGCTVHTSTEHDSGVYWCVSTRGSSCRGINITVAGQPVLSHSIPVTEGQDVPLHCKAENSNSRAEFFKDGSVVGNGTSSDVTIRNFSASDQGQYWCRVNGRESPRSWLLIEDSSEEASLSVWPNTAQFFEYDPVSLSCGSGSQSRGWKVLRAVRSGTSDDKRSLQFCGSQWGNRTSSGCHIHTAIPHDSGSYWCESPTKALSNLVNISVFDVKVKVILRIPATPVKAGDSVTLRCEAQPSPTNPAATFFRNGSPYRTEPTGTMSIARASPCDEGIYRCYITDVGESPSSWLFVTGSTEAADASKAEHTHPLLGVMRHLLVMCPYCISTVLVVFIYKSKAGGGGAQPVPGAAEDPQLDPQDEDVDADVTTEHHF